MEKIRSVFYSCLVAFCSILALANPVVAQEGPPTTVSGWIAKVKPVDKLNDGATSLADFWVTYGTVMVAFAIALGALALIYRFLRGSGSRAR